MGLEGFRVQGLEFRVPGNWKALLSARYVRARADLQSRVEHALQDHGGLRGSGLG